MYIECRHYVYIYIFFFIYCSLMHVVYIQQGICRVFTLDINMYHNYYILYAEI